MQAVILVGGEGTRLRPLTSTVPKPVVPLVDRPFIAYMLEWLRGHGVDDVVISCGFLATQRAQRARRRLRLRAAAALRRGARAARHRRRAQVRRVAARRALPDAQRRRAHRHRPDRADRPARADGRARDARARAGRRPDRLRARAPRRATRSVRGFLEKPSPDQIDTNLISAGAYVLERDVLADDPAGRNVSIEREVWPPLVGDGLYGYAGARLLAGHRHARALPAGDLRHPRRRVQHVRCTDALRRAAPSPSPTDVAGDGRVVGPALVGAGAHDRRRRARDGRTRARPRRRRSARARTSSARSCSTAPRRRRTRCSRTAIVGARRARRRRTPHRRGRVLGEGVTLGADNELAGRRPAVPERVPSRRSDQV